MNQILCEIFVICMSVISWVLVYLMIRNNLVGRFRLKLIDIAHTWSVNCGSHKQSDWAFYWFLDQIASHEKMLFSFKRLKLKNWCTQEQLDKLLADPEVKQKAEELKVL